MHFKQIYHKHCWEEHFQENKTGTKRQKPWDTEPSACQRYLRYKTAPNRGSNYHISTAKVMTKKSNDSIFSWQIAKMSSL